LRNRFEKICGVSAFGELSWRASARSELFCMESAFDIGLRGMFFLVQALFNPTPKVVWMKRWFAGFILAGWLSSVAGHAQTDIRPIPFTVSPETGLLMIPVSVGGGETTPFVLDTGSGISVLSQSLVDKLGGKPAGRFTGFRLTGERIDLQLFTIPELRLGPVVEKNALVAGWNGLDKFHLAGMISLDFFRDRPFTLDFRSHQLVLETARGLAARRKHGSLVPVQLDDMRGISMDLFAPFRIDGKAAECEVDTGSQGYVFASRYMSMLGLTAQSSGVEESEHTSILGNKEVRYRALAPSLRLDDTEMGTEDKPSVLFEDIIYDCNVGIDFWKNRVVTFDIPHKETMVSER
jgi:hypothetical protein